MLKYLKYTFFVVSIFIVEQALGQTNVNSPYSRIGIGDLQTSNGLTRNIGMGGIGVASRNPHFINLINPALLANYRDVWQDSTVKYEVGFIGIARRLSTKASSETDVGANINYLALAFPVNKTWAISAGLMPFSSVDHSLSHTFIIQDSTSSGATVRNTYTGSGGLYQAVISNGVGITRNISVGLEASYLFGNITNESFASVISTEETGVRDRLAYKGFGFKPGVSFRKAQLLDSIRGKTFVYSAGFTYQFYTGVNADRELTLLTQLPGGLSTFDSVIVDSRGKAKLPGTYRVGFNFESVSRISVGADFSFSNWSQFSSPGISDTLKDSYAINVGAEIYGKNKQAGTKLYRVGVMYAKTPIFLNGKQLNDIAFTLGTSLPFGEFRSSPILPKINLALVFGQRGAFQNGLIKDQYLKAYISATINDKWFARRRIQ